MTHHHHGGTAHPSPSVRPSLLRLSVQQRIVVAGVLVALIWLLALWAIH